MSDAQNTPRFSTIGITYTKHQNNAALSMSPAEDSTMRRLGFTSFRAGMPGISMPGGTALSFRSKSSFIIRA